jgi:hypothetical protein
LRKKIIKEEIKGNPEEKIADLMEQRKGEEDAINKAILLSFGDIEDIKSELGVHKTKKEPIYIN